MIHPTSAFLSRIFGSRSEGALFITRLPNEKGGGGHHPRCVTRLCDVVEQFIEKHDQPGFAIYFCVSTLKPGRTWRNKRNVNELVCLHADVDLKGIDATPAKVKRVLASLPLPPQIVVFSGHGYHAYWVLTKALPASEQNITRLEAALKKLADVLAADKQVCHVAALMRLPGSHNTKHGEWTEVRTVTKRPGSFTFERIEKWLNKATRYPQWKAISNLATFQFSEKAATISRRVLGFCRVVHLKSSSLTLGSFEATCTGSTKDKRASLSQPL